MSQWTEHSEKVAQAAGMVSVQVDCSLDEAFAMIEARAAIYPSETIETVASAVIDRSIRFGPET